MPKDGVMKCSSCGTLKKESKLIDKKKKEFKFEVTKEETPETLPKIKADCEKCKNDQAFFWTLQTRSSDEPETRFFRCTKCNNVWREY